MGFDLFAKKGCGMKEEVVDKDKKALEGISDSSESSESSESSLKNSSSSSSDCNSSS